MFFGDTLTPNDINCTDDFNENKRSKINPISIDLINNVDSTFIIGATSIRWITDTIRK